MTPKEKAEELVNKFLNLKIDLTEACWTRMKIKAAKQCALIAVDEILNGLNSITDKYVELGMRAFMQEVKQEIEKL